MVDFVVAACVALIVIGVIGFFVTRSSSSSPSPSSSSTPQPTTAAPQPAEDESLFGFNIYYGSQTGTAEGFAKQIKNEARAHGFKATLVDLEDFETEMLTTPPAGSEPMFAIFMMATYGEGDPTDNAVDFLKWVKDNDLPATTLSHLRFTVFGLGNRQYEHYNAMGRLVNERLAALGGTHAYKYGEGDDDGTLEEDFDGWRESLWAELSTSLGIQTAGAGSGAGAGSQVDTACTLPPIEWKMVHTGRPDPAEATAMLQRLQQHKPSGLAMASRHYFSARPLKVVNHYELRTKADACNTTKYIELDLEGSGITYGTADDLAVLPENDPEIVESLARWLGYDLEQWFTLEPAENLDSAPKAMFPTPCTVRTALTRYCDLTQLPSKQLLGYLSNFAEKSDDRERLRRMASRDGKAEFHDWATTPERSIFEIFQEFPSVKPPLSVLLQLLPRLAVRYYTIASSSLVHPTTVQLAVSVIRRPKPAGHGSRELVGVCSNFLSNRSLPEDSDTKTQDVPGRTSVVYCDMRASNFKLPEDLSTPVLLIGPGTGVAPMRAFLQERRQQKQAGQSVGPTVLYFGCRRRDEDFIFQDELQSYLADGTLTELHTAFSREQAHKVYVQDRIRETGAAVWGLISSGASVYVCGATTMGEDVKNALTAVIEEHGSMSNTEALAFVSKLTEDKKYIQELWS